MGLWQWLMESPADGRRRRELRTTRLPEMLELARQGRKLTLEAAARAAYAMEQVESYRAATATWNRLLALAGRHGRRDLETLAGRLLEFSAYAEAAFAEIVPDLSDSFVAIREIDTQNMDAFHRELAEAGRLGIDVSSYDVPDVAPSDLKQAIAAVGRDLDARVAELQAQIKLHGDLEALAKYRTDARFGESALRELVGYPALH